jgi:hypothetical protein
MTLMNSEVLLLADGTGFFAYNFTTAPGPDGVVHPFWLQSRQHTIWSFIVEAPLFSPPVMVSPSVARCSTVIGSDLHTISISLDGNPEKESTTVRRITIKPATPIGCITSKSGAYYIERCDPTSNYRNSMFLFTYHSGRSPRDDSDDSGFCSYPTVFTLPKFVKHADEDIIAGITCNEDITRMVVLVGARQASTHSLSMYVLNLTSR